MDGQNTWLDDVEYPATKETLIDAAVESKAPQEVVERLQQLSQEQYESRDELARDLGQG